MFPTILQNLIPLGIMLVLAMIGFVLRKRSFASLEERRKFVFEYVNNLTTFANKFYGGGEADRDLYQWLNLNMFKAQNELGSSGLVMYRPPFENYIINNYPVIVNTIPSIIQGPAMTSQHDVTNCVALLTARLGTLDEMLKEAEKGGKNPLLWLRDGARFVIALPLVVLAELGILGGRAVEGITSSYIAKLISGLIVIAGLISSVVTVVIGWDQFVLILGRVLNISTP